MTGTVREYLYAGGEAPTAMRARQPDGSYANYFFVTNTHGDVVALTDKDGTIVNRYAYGPWGEATRVSETVHQPFRYAGYRYEDGFDLYYLRARWMDPNTGRFLSRDDYSGERTDLSSLNRYVYTSCSPATRIDPSGRLARCPKEGIYELAAILNAWDSYLPRREVVNQVGLRLVGFSQHYLDTGPHLVGIPGQGPQEVLGAQGFRTGLVDEENPSQHLMAFFVAGSKDWGSWLAYLTEYGAFALRKPGASEEDVRLGKIGYGLGADYGSGRIRAGDLGITLIRRAGSNSCESADITKTSLVWGLPPSGTPSPAPGPL